MDRASRLVVLALAGAAVLGADPSRARADLTVWEEHAEDPAQHRSLAITGLLQPGFLVREEGDVSPNTASTYPTTTQFLLQRARLGVKARLFPWLFWRLELEASPTPTLTDAYVDLEPSQYFGVRVGQFQLAFLRTYQFNEANLAFIDRLVYTPQNPERTAIRYLSPRDIGVMLHGRFGDVDPEHGSPVLEYFAGAFLGRGPNQLINDDGAYLWSARINLHILGVPKGVDAESDLANNARPKVSVGAGVYANCDDRGDYNRGFTADAELRWAGFFAYATFVWLRNGAAGNDDLGRALGYGGRDNGYCRNGLRGDPSGRDAQYDFVSWGASVQAQYVFPRWIVPIPGQSFELLARFDYVAPYNPWDGSFLGFAGVPPGVSAPPGVQYLVPPSYRDADNPPSRYRLTFGVNWFPTGAQNVRVSLNYQLNLEDEAVNYAGNYYAAVHNDIAWLQASFAI